MGRVDSGKAPGNKCCVDSTLVMNNRKMSNCWPLFCHGAHCPRGQAGLKEPPTEQHTFIRRVVRTQEEQRAEGVV